MKTTCLPIIALLCGCALGCTPSKSSTHVTPSGEVIEEEDDFVPSKIVEYIPFRDATTHKWGLVGTNGEVLCKDVFVQEPSLVLNGRFFVSDGAGEDGEYDGTQYYIYSAEKEPKLLAGPFRNRPYLISGVSIALLDESHPLMIIDRNGEKIADVGPVDGHMVYYCEQLHDGYAVFATDEGKHGVIDEQGKVVMAPKYVDMRNLGQGLFMVTEAESENQEFYDENRMGTVIDVKGKKRFSAHFIAAEAAFKDIGNGLYTQTLHDGKICYFNNRGGTEENIKYLLDTQTGKTKRMDAALDAAMIQNFVGDRFIAKRSEEEGDDVRNLDGKVLFAPIKQDIFYMNDTHYWRGKFGKNYHLVDTIGMPVGTEAFTAVCPSYNGKSAFALRGNEVYNVQEDGTAQAIGLKVERFAQDDQIDDMGFTTRYDKSLVEKAQKMSCKLPDKKMELRGDLPTFDVRGQVKRVTLSSTQRDEPAVYDFDQQGKITSINGRQASTLQFRRVAMPSWPKKSEVQQIEAYQPNETDGVCYSYNLDGTLANYSTYGDDGEGVNEYYVVNENGYALYKTEEVGDHAEYPYNTVWIYVYQEFDSQGNWIKRTVKPVKNANDEMKAYVETRKITYY